MTDWKRAALRRMVWPALIFVIGLAIVIAAGDGDLLIIGSGVMGVGVTVFVALVFLEVGYSEDREREGK